MLSTHQLLSLLFIFGLGIAIGNVCQPQRKYVTQFCNPSLLSEPFYMIFLKGCVCVCMCVPFYFRILFILFTLLFSYTFLLYSDYTAIEIAHVTQSEVTFSNFIQRATVSSDVSTETAKAAKEAGLVNELETTVNSLEATLDFSPFFLLLFHDLDEILCDGNVVSL